MGAAAGLKIEPDDLTYPMAPPVEAARLGIYALTRLKNYDALVLAVLDQQGQPVTRWWPVAYAFQRVGDDRAAPTLLTLLNTPGRYTASFELERADGAVRQHQPRHGDRALRRHLHHIGAAGGLRGRRARRHLGARGIRLRCNRHLRRTGLFGLVG